MTSYHSPPETVSARPSESRRSTRQTSGLAPGRQSKRVVSQRLVTKPKTLLKEESNNDGGMTAILKDSEDSEGESAQEEKIPDLADFFKKDSKIEKDENCRNQEDERQHQIASETASETLSSQIPEKISFQTVREDGEGEKQSDVEESIKEPPKPKCKKTQVIVYSQSST